MSQGYDVEVEVNGENMGKEVDTAGYFSIINRDMYVKRFKFFYF